MWRLMQSGGGWMCVDAARYVCTNTYTNPEDAWNEANKIDEGLVDWNERWEERRAEIKRLAAEIKERMKQRATA